MCRVRIRWRLAILLIHPMLAAMIACASPPPSAPPVAPAAPASPVNLSDPAAEPVVGDVSIDVTIPPAVAYQVFTAEIGQWWGHTFSTTPYLLRLDARPGGAFIEFFDGDGNVVEHGRVIYAKAGEGLRIVGPYGFSGQGLEFVHDFKFTPRPDGGTTVSLHLEVIGRLDSDARGMVLAVWKHFLTAFQRHTTTRKPADATATFAQPPHPDPANVGHGFFSHLGLGAARNHVHADDFRLTSNATLVGIRFWGHSEGLKTPDLDNIREFSLRVHQATPDATPGPIVYEQLAPMAATKPAPTGRRALAQRSRPGAREHVHELQLAVPLPLQANATYFVSIAAGRHNAEGDGWMWSDSTPRNGRSFSHPLHDPRWQAIDDTDSAFELLLASP